MLQQFTSGRIVFALGLFAIGLWGLAEGGFVGIWAPGIQPAGLRAPTAMLCSAVSIFTAAGLFWKHSEHLAARIFFAWLLVWLLWCKGVVLLHAPGDASSWESAGETALVMAAALALASSPSAPRLLYGLSLIAFGVAHFSYSKPTASLVPAWLPWHLEWVYLTGACYVAAGFALLLDRVAKVAAALAALQMAFFGVLVWLPKIAAGSHPDTLNEAAISFALASSGWVIAARLRKGPHEES